MAAAEGFRPCDFPDEVRAVLEDLAFLRMARPGEKIDIEARKYVSPLVWGDIGNWIAWGMRMFKQQSRETTIRNVVGLVSRANDLLSSRPEFGDLTLQYLAESVEGLRALKVTYADHPGTLARLDVLLEQISRILSQNRRARPLPIDREHSTHAGSCQKASASSLVAASSNETASSSRAAESYGAVENF